MAPSSLVFGSTQGGSALEPSTYAQELLWKLTHAHEVARTHLRSAQSLQKRTYVLKLHDKTYEPGDLVYVLQKSHKPGQCRKLKQIWTGPYLVLEMLTPAVYRLRGQKKETVLHHDRLKLFRDRSAPVWMQRLRHRFLATGTAPPVPKRDPTSTALSNDKYLRDIRHLFAPTKSPARTSPSASHGLSVRDPGSSPRDTTPRRPRRAPAYLQDYVHPR